MKVSIVKTPKCSLCGADAQSHIPMVRCETGDVEIGMYREVFICVLCHRQIGTVLGHE